MPQCKGASRKTDLLRLQKHLSPSECISEQDAQQQVKGALAGWVRLGGRFAWGDA